MVRFTLVVVARHTLVGDEGQTEHGYVAMPRCNYLRNKVNMLMESTLDPAPAESGNSKVAAQIYQLTHCMARGGT